MSADQDAADEFEMLVAAYRGLPSTSETPTAVLDDPWSMPDYRARNVLALSVLQHTDATDVEGTRLQLVRAVLALQGATIDEIAMALP